MKPIYLALSSRRGENQATRFIAFTVGKEKKEGGRKGLPGGKGRKRKGGKGKGDRLPQCHAISPSGREEKRKEKKAISEFRRRGGKKNTGLKPTTALLEKKGVRRSISQGKQAPTWLFPVSEGRGKRGEGDPGNHAQRKGGKSNSAAPLLIVLYTGGGGRRRYCRSGGGWGEGRECGGTLLHLRFRGEGGERTKKQNCCTSPVPRGGGKKDSRPPSLSCSEGRGKSARRVPFLVGGTPVLVATLEHMSRRGGRGGGTCLPDRGEGGGG